MGNASTNKLIMDNANLALELIEEANNLLVKAQNTANKSVKKELAAKAAELEFEASTILSKSRHKMKFFNRKKIDYKQESLILGHLIKYNLYLQYKARLFNTISNKYPEKSCEELVNITNDIALLLDTDSAEQQNKPQ